MGAISLLTEVLYTSINGGGTLMMMTFDPVDIVMCRFTTSSNVPGPVEGRFEMLLWVPTYIAVFMIFTIVQDQMACCATLSMHRDDHQNSFMDERSQVRLITPIGPFDNSTFINRLSSSRINCSIP